MIHYPEARRAAIKDVYQGQVGPVEVNDPFRWMEAIDSPETLGWIAAENQVTQEYLATLPNRSAIKERVAALLNFERYGIPTKVAGKYYFLKNNGTQNQSVFYRADSLTSEPEVLIDPNLMSGDGRVAVDVYKVSPNGRFLAYAIQENGTDWRRWRVMDLNRKTNTADEILWSKFGDPVAWAKDSSGFYYTRFPEPKSDEEMNFNHKIYYHQLGAKQSDDALVYERPQDPTWNLGAELSEDGRYLFVTGGPANYTNVLLVRDLHKADAPFTPIFAEPNASYQFIGNIGTTFYIATNLDAPNYRVVAVDAANPGVLREMIPNGNDTLAGASLLGHKLVASYLKDAHSVTKIYDADGRFIRDVEFPEPFVTAGGFARVTDDGESFFSYSSFLNPGAVYAYNLETGVSTLFKKATSAFDGSAFETRQVFFTSKDGTRVPMFITAKKGLVLNGQNPTLLYGYGGFKIPVTPAFNTFNVAWLERGGVYVSANIRGGSEYGDEWHDQGTVLRKQNVFDDFIAAAEYLIRENFTSPQKLAIRGGSNGGLLVGACLLQRPELFGAALPEVGVMDMLRFNKFSAGRYWVKDYGSPEPLPDAPDHWNPQEFDALYRISPYHQALAVASERREFPATLVATADHDDRVWPMHSFKFAAALQLAQSGHEPVLIRIETNAGHGSGLPLSKSVQATADKLAFIEAAFAAKANAGAPKENPAPAK